MARRRALDQGGRTLGLGGLGGLGGPSFPGPEGLAAFARSPMARALLDNPDALASLMASMPGAAELAAAHPELGAALRDPATLRAALGASLDPAAAARAHDRALANLEAMPGGFNALRQMQETFGESLDAAAGLGGALAAGAGPGAGAGAGGGDRKSTRLNSSH